jgi:hypothetical protein
MGSGSPSERRHDRPRERNPLPWSEAAVLIGALSAVCWAILMLIALGIWSVLFYG